MGDGERRRRSLLNGGEKQKDLFFIFIEAFILFLPCAQTKSLEEENYIYIYFFGNPFAGGFFLFLFLSFWIINESDDIVLSKDLSE